MQILTKVGVDVYNITQKWAFWTKHYSEVKWVTKNC